MFSSHLVFADFPNVIHHYMEEFRISIFGSKCAYQGLFPYEHVWGHTMDASAIASDVMV